MFSHRTLEVARSPERPPHVLLVHPRVEDADSQEVAEWTDPERRVRLLRQVVVAQPTQVPEALLGHLTELLEHLVARPGAPEVDHRLVHPAHRVLEVWKVTDLV